MNRLRPYEVLRVKLEFRCKQLTNAFGQNSFDQIIQIKPKTVLEKDSANHFGPVWYTLLFTVDHVIWALQLLLDKKRERKELLLTSTDEHANLPDTSKSMPANHSSPANTSSTGNHDTNHQAPTEAHDDKSVDHAPVNGHTSQHKQHESVTKTTSKGL